MSLTTARRYTADDLLAMPGDGPWELWDGELRKEPTAGQEASHVAGNIYFFVKLFNREHRLGVVTIADGGYVLSEDPVTVVVPDVGFARWGRLPDHRMTTKNCPVPPDLAVEVRSPTDEPGKMAAKRDLYARARVPLLWWVDPSDRTVTVHRVGAPPVVLTEGDELDGGDVLPGLRIPVVDIFTEDE